MRLYRPHILLQWFLLGVFCAAGLSACVDPLTTGPVDKTTAEHDAWVMANAEFNAGKTDSVFALVSESTREQTVAFGNLVVRPNFYNSCVNGGYYISIEATHTTGNNSFESMSLRLDNIRDTGVYKIKGLFTVPKPQPDKPAIDTTAPIYHGATYTRRGEEGLLASYQASLMDGEIHVLRIDREVGIIIGTFWFSAYDAVSGTTILIKDGTFRIRIK